MLPWRCSGGDPSPITITMIVGLTCMTVALVVSHMAGLCTAAQICSCWRFRPSCGIHLDLDSLFLEVR